MASIHKRNDSACFHAAFRDAAGKLCMRSTGIRDEGTPVERAKAKRDAKDIATMFETVARGDATEAKIRRTVSDLFNRVNGERIEWAKAGAFLKRWLDSVKLRKSAGTFSRYETVVDGFLASLGAGADKSLADVTTGDVQSFVDSGLRAGKRPTTLRLEMKILNACFAYSLRQGLIIVNPVAAAEVPEESSESKRPFTWQQICDILAACDPAHWEKGDRILPRLADWRTAITFAAFTGARLGDVRNLRWRNIDLTGKLIRFRPAKTKRRRRKDGDDGELKIPMHPDLEAHVFTLSAPDDPETPVAPTLAGDKIGGRSGLSRQFQRIMANAGVVNEVLAGGKKSGGRTVNAFGFHSLRHSFNSLLADAGVEQDLRMALSGHAGERVSELYTHRGIATLRGAVSKLPGIKQ